MGLQKLSSGEYIQINFEDFFSDMRKIEKTLQEDADKIPRAFGIELTRTVIYATPVDKGTARGNWFISTGAPSEEIQLEDADAKTAMERLSADIAQINGKTINFLSNNLPYISRLNDGYSLQAPAQFVEQAALDVANSLDKIAAAVRNK